MAYYRATENEEETSVRREENRFRMEILRELEEQREREDEELRVRNALEHGDIVPIETEEEVAIRLQLLTERNRIGNPRTHRLASKEIVVEDHVHLLDFLEIWPRFVWNVTPNTSRKNCRRTRSSSNAAKREMSLFHFQSNVRNHWPVSCKASTRNRKFS